MLTAVACAHNTHTCCCCPVCLCAVCVQVNPWSRTKEHKFKVSVLASCQTGAPLPRIRPQAAGTAGLGMQPAGHWCVDTAKNGEARGLTSRCGPRARVCMCVLLLQVTAVMVTHAVEYSGHGDFTDSVLLDNINPAPSTSTKGQHQQEQQPAGQG